MTTVKDIITIVEDDFVYYVSTGQQDKASAYYQTLVDIGYEIEDDMTKKIEELRQIGLQKRGCLK